MFSTFEIYTLTEARDQSSNGENSLPDLVLEYLYFLGTSKGSNWARKDSNVWGLRS